jgi:hypothetical protein
MVTVPSAVSVSIQVLIRSGAGEITAATVFGQMNTTGDLRLDARNQYGREGSLVLSGSRLYVTLRPHWYVTDVGQLGSVLAQVGPERPPAGVGEACMARAERLDVLLADPHAALGGIELFQDAGPESVDGITATLWRASLDRRRLAGALGMVLGIDEACAQLAIEIFVYELDLEAALDAPGTAELWLGADDGLLRRARFGLRDVRGRELVADVQLTPAASAFEISPPASAQSFR